MRKMLPRSLEELAGLRAARYRRESTEEQGTKYGPAEQDAEIERFMARYGLVDTGIVFTDHHSGWQRPEARPEFTAMMAAATEGAFDVLVVAYFSRFSRNIRQALEAHDILHRGGVAIAFADERFVSSDEDAWEDFVDEAVSAEKYSRKLSRRIKNTLRAKFERYATRRAPRALASVGPRSPRRASPSTPPRCPWPCGSSRSTPRATSRTSSSGRDTAWPRAASGPSSRTVCTTAGQCATAAAPTRSCSRRPGAMTRR